MDSVSSFGNISVPLGNEEDHASQQQEIDSFNCKSISTNSMVTVRLSDATISPSMIEAFAQEEAAAEEPFYNDESAAEELESAIDRNRNSVSFSEDLNFMEKSYRASTASVPSILDEGNLGSTSGTFRSRSDSSGTFSSAGSAHVDWEELEKSEEQAPRDEGSDEVTSQSQELAFYLY